MDWKPIEKAPKGKKILLHRRDGRRHLYSLGKVCPDWVHRDITIVDCGSFTVPLDHAISTGWKFTRITPPSE